MVNKLVNIHVKSLSNKNDASEHYWMHFLEEDSNSNELASLHVSEIEKLHNKRLIV